MKKKYQHQGKGLYSGLQCCHSAAMVPDCYAVELGQRLCAFPFTSQILCLGFTFDIAIAPCWKGEMLGNAFPKHLSLERKDA